MMSVLSAPGHFSLPLSCNRKTASIERLRYKQKVLRCHLRANTKRPERHAIRNLLGLLAARLEQYDEALGHFMRITSDREDACNLNAFANMKHVCELQYRFRESASYESKLREYSNLANTEDSGDILSLQPESRRLHARCMAEQAFAIAFDLDDMPHKHQGHRYRRAYDLYRQALRAGNDDVDTEEIEDWKYHLGIICYNIGTTLKDESGTQSEWLSYMKESLAYFSDKFVAEDKDKTAESWCYIAKVLQLCESEGTMLQWVVEMQPQLEQFVGKSEECIEKAVQTNPDKASVYIHHAELIRDNSVQEAIDLVGKAIDLDDTSVMKRGAYSERGRLLTRKYKLQTTTFRDHIYASDGSDDEQFHSNALALEPEREMLFRAKDDFEIAIDIAVNPSDLAALGEIWHLLARDSIGEVFSAQKEEEDDDQVRDNLNKALMYFTQATHCMDGALDARINHLRGLCLFDSDESEAALESFKQAIECQPLGQMNIEYFASLMEVYLSLISDNIGDKRYQTRLLSEMVYWSNVAISSYGASDVRKHLLHSDQWSDMPEAVDVFLKFCESTDHDKLHMVFSAARSRTARTRRRRRLSLRAITRARTPSPTPTPSPSTPETRNKPPTPVSAPAASKGKPAFPVACESETETPRRSTHEKHETTTAHENGTVSIPLTHPNAVASGDAPSAPTISIPSSTEQIVNLDDLKTDEIPEAPEHARFEGYANDFFVIYSPLSSDWVHYNLLPKLERTQGLKGCTKDRDFVAGRYIVQNYATCIDSSAVVLLILTKDFEKRPDCRSFMSQALTPEEGKEDKLVIPIIREDDCKIPSVLRHISPFKATGVVNWNKLGHAIENLVKTSDES